MDARGSRARDDMERVRGRADDEHARGDRAWIRPSRASAEGAAAGRAQGAVLGDRGVARRSGGAVFRRGSARWWSSAWSPKRTTPTSSSPSTRATRATRSSSCGASARGRSIEEDHMRNRQTIVHWLMANTHGDRRARARRQDVLRDDRRGGLPRRRRPAARRGDADQGRRGLRGRARARRDLRRSFRSGAARRSRRRAWIG